MVFLLDSSNNVGEDDIKRQVELIVTVASTLDFNNIGVIAYASDAHYLIKPGQESSFSDFAHTLRTANYSLGKYKNLGKALIKCSEEPKFDDSKVGIVVAMIAGKAEDEYAVPAALLQQNHVTIIGLVLGSNYSISELNHLVTNPNEEHILRSEFADLKHFAGTTRNAICKGWLRANNLERNHDQPTNRQTDPTSVQKRKNERTKLPTNQRANVRTRGKKCERLNVLTDEQTNERTNEQKYEQTKQRRSKRTNLGKNERMIEISNESMN